MEWLAKRIFLHTREDKETALVQFATLFFKRIEQEDGITNWYCSRKDDINLSNPSIRIYMKIDQAQELQLISKLESLLREKANVIGWTGKYEVEPTVPTSAPEYQILKQIQQGCKTTFDLMKKYPETNRINDDEFKNRLCREIQSQINSMPPEYNMILKTMPAHFIANNLGLGDLIDGRCYYVFLDIKTKTHLKFSVQ